MNYVVFENDGEIDIRTIKTFGVSIKEGDSPIGFFGTGLKYAIAILMRRHCFLEIQSGETVLKISVKISKIRGKDVSMIMMNDEELPFTTHLGSNWELWQAFREIYCNCKDESGELSIVGNKPAPVVGKTRIIVRDASFEGIAHECDSIILNLPNTDKALLNGMEVYDKSSEYLYYRGIRVASLKNQAMFTYNMTRECTLTEDRTLKYSNIVYDEIYKKIAALKNKVWIDRILLADIDTWEAGFSFLSLEYYPQYISNEFHEVIARHYQMNNDKINRTALSLFAKITKKDSIKSLSYIDLDSIEIAQLERAKSICNKLFYDFDDYGIKFVKTLGQTTLAMAVEDDQCMVISKRCFELGTKFLVSTMIEEYAHLKTGHGDETRELQTYLFDTICTITEKPVIGEAI